MDRPDVAPRGAAATMFLDLLREADAPLAARALKRLLVDRGEPAGAVDAAWRRAQPLLRRHPEVAFDPVRGVYRYKGEGPAVPDIGAEEALNLLLPARLTPRKADLAATVRNTLAQLSATAAEAVADRDALESRLRAGYTQQRALRAAQEHQIQLGAVRTLVDVVSEVDELAAAGVPPDVMVERVRALAHAFGLRAIGRAGEHTRFAPAWHTPIGGRPPDDSRVVVVRPGYTWHDGGEDVLVARAQVVAATVHSGGSG